MLATIYDPKNHEQSKENARILLYKVLELVPDKSVNPRDWERTNGYATTRASSLILGSKTSASFNMTSGQMATREWYALMHILRAARPPMKFSMRLGVDFMLHVSTTEQQ